MSSESERSIDPDENVLSNDNDSTIEIIDTLMGDTDLIGQEAAINDDLNNDDAAGSTTTVEHISQDDSVESRVALIAKTLEITDSRAWFLAAMFNVDYYKTNAGLSNHTDAQVFSHYIESGIRQNRSPSPAFEPAFVKTALLKQELIDEDDSDELCIMLAWLEYGYTSIPGHPLFEEACYLATYPDIAASVDNAYAHFATNGIYENRVSGEWLKLQVDTVSSNFPEDSVSLATLFTAIPEGYAADFTKPETQVVLKKIFMPTLYRAQIEADATIDDNALYAHFLLFSGTSHDRPTLLFHEAYYANALENYKPEFKDTDLLREFTELSDEHVATCLEKGTASPYFHWFFKGMSLGIVPTPLFETDHYIFSHNDIRTNWNQHPFMHFVATGVREPFRKFTSLFDNNYYTHQIKGLKNPGGALLDYVVRGQFENASTVAGIRLEEFSADEPLKSSSLEEAALFFSLKVNRLKSGVLADMVAKAEYLEPQLSRPYGARFIRQAPLFHPEADVTYSMRKVTPNLPKKQYDTLILIPHCRMAGSAKVAGNLTHAMASLTDQEKVLVITTDLSAFERPEWFPDNVDVFDLSQYLEDMGHERKVRMLLDVIRGLRTKRIINVNSNLAWHLTKNYGKQLSSWTDIYVYLFCWDRDIKGNKGGYPIQWFLPTFDHCKAVFTDTLVLRQELHDRYCIGETARNKIVALHSPADDIEVSYEEALTQRTAAQGVRRVFWSGRFDKQKRIDVLFAVAKRLPDIEFWVWGKPVLNDSGIDVNASPENIKFMGEYENIDDLPIASCDCFLYTSGWDGLPIILINVGTRAVPIIASDVGGVSDLIDESTGWPIKDYANPDSYCQAINEVLGDYPAALQKGIACREHALELCSKDNYLNTIASTMRLESK